MTDMQARWHIGQNELALPTGLQLYVTNVSTLVRFTDWNTAKSTLSQFVQPHPVDTHPPFAQRLQALGVSAAALAHELAMPAADPAISLVPASSELEEGLTYLEIKWLEAIGAVVLPKEEARAT